MLQLRPRSQLPLDRTGRRCCDSALGHDSRNRGKDSVQTSSANEFQIIGSRTWEEISPFAFTSPAATFVPPMSTPTNQFFLNPSLFSERDLRPKKFV
jgi:hypothetical protein